MHPRFDRAKAEGFLAKTAIRPAQHVLTDLMVVNRGRIVLDCTMEEVESRSLEVMVPPEHVAAARELRPIHERQLFGRTILLFDHADRQQLASLGELPGMSTGTRR